MTLSFLICKMASQIKSRVNRDNRGTLASVWPLGVVAAFPHRSRCDGAQGGRAMFGHVRRPRGEVEVAEWP